MNLLKILGISMLITAVMFSGCIDTAETDDNDTLQTNVSTNEATNVSKTEQDTTYSNLTNTEFNTFDSQDNKHDAYITGYPDRTDDYYLEHPKETEILDDLVLKLDEVISEDYSLDCYIKTCDDSESSVCNATILSDRLIVNDIFITGTIETINYIDDTYKIDRIQMTMVDTSTGEGYYEVETSGPNYKDIKLIFKYALGDEYQITYWNKDLNNYTIEKLN
ncbi:hypothetical protein [Methanococcus sp. CF]